MVSILEGTCLIKLVAPLPELKKLPISFRSLSFEFHFLSQKLGKVTYVFYSYGVARVMFVILHYACTLLSSFDFPPPACLFFTRMCNVYLLHLYVHLEQL